MLDNTGIQYIPIKDFLASTIKFISSVTSQSYCNKNKIENKKLVTKKLLHKTTSLLTTFVVLVVSTGSLVPNNYL